MCDIFDIVIRKPDVRETEERLYKQAETIAALEARLKRIEDLEAIRSLLMRYCLMADSGDADGVRALFADAVEVDLDAAIFFSDAEAVSASFRSPAHQAMLPNAAHVPGPLLIDLDGDRAVATGYMALFIRNDSTHGLTRLSLGRWELARSAPDAGWQVVKRTARSVGRADTRELIATATSGF